MTLNILPMVLEREEKIKIFKNEKKNVLLLAVAIFFTAMSFRTSPDFGEVYLLIKYKLLKAIINQ